MEESKKVGLGSQGNLWQIINISNGIWSILLEGIDQIINSLEKFPLPVA